MPNKVILDYLSQNLKKGYPASSLRERLIAAGYPQNEVDEALRYLRAGSQPEKPSVPPVSQEEKPVPKQAREPAKQPQKDMKDEEREKKAQNLLEKQKKEQEEKDKEEQKKSRQKRGHKKDKSKKPDKKSEKKKAKSARSKRKRSISSNKVILIAAIIAIVEVGSFVGLVSFGFIDIGVAEACVEDWGCASWRPRTCPPNATQTRRCFDANGCGTNMYIPDTQQSCVPVDGGPYIFTEYDFTGAGMEVAEFFHFTRGLDMNGSAYNSYISVATTGRGSVIRTSVAYGPSVNLIYDENAFIMSGMNINASDTGEYGTRSSRYEVSDLGSGTLLVQDGEWYLGIEYETSMSDVADDLAVLFIQKTP
jgi:hypothetical protein